jgi:hypothetical protein
LAAAPFWVCAMAPSSVTSSSDSDTYKGAAAPVLCEVIGEPIKRLA